MAKPKRYTVSDGKLVLTLEAAEEGGYIVTSPFNPDVLTQAETLEEAFENARDVIALFKEDRASSKSGRTSAASTSRGRTLPRVPSRYSAVSKSPKTAIKRKPPSTRQTNPV